MTAIAMAIGIVGGTIIAVMRLSDNPVLRVVAWLYVWLFRGVPLLVQIIFWGFLGALYPTVFVGIPFVGVVFGHGNTSALIGSFTAAILALGLNEVAYAAELVRAGIISVDEGQTEAAYSIGMSRGVTMRRVVLPQAMRVIIPPMGNETITMLKMTSLVSVISGNDLLTTVQKVYEQNFQVIPLLIVASLWYLALTTVLTVGQHYLEKRFGRGFGQADAGRADRKASEEGGPLMADQPMVCAEEVWKSFGKLDVLKGIDFVVQPRETIVLLGPSGGGKSTILRCINHLEKIDARAPVGRRGTHGLSPAGRACCTR